MDADRSDPLHGTDRDPPFPFELGPVSNGEFLPRPRSAFAAEVQRRTLADAEAHARRLGMDRRRFLLTLGGAATMLLAINACSSDESASGASTSGPRSTPRTTGPGGTFTVPSTAPLEPTTAADVLAGDEFVFDVQTHFLDYLRTGAPGDWGLGFPQAACGVGDDPRACFGYDQWLTEVFANSDTAMAVISAVPILSEPNPLGPEIMAEAREAARLLCGDGRVLLHGQVNPNVGNAAARLDGMRALAGEYELGAWKVYTHVGSPPWSLDDHDPDGAQVGRAFLDTVMEVGPRVVCVHKGLGDPYWASPADIGPAALAYPDIAFVAYHSGYESGIAEGPYEPGVEHRGIDRLIETVVEHGPGAGANVYAELGTTWFSLMGSPDAAAHTLGKLLKHLGPDNVLWGTDSIWYGTPQQQIEAFRAFQISEEFQERFGYPALTDEVKRKILGQNAARLHGVAPVTELCRPSADELDELRVAAGPRRTYGPRTTAEAAALMAEHGMAIA
jgi:predicted TIM-barrel fold metal-dependent hydrolase